MAQFQVSLNEDNVREAKDYQKRMSGAENLSGLLNSLLEGWVQSKRLIIDQIEILNQIDIQKTAPGDKPVKVITHGQGDPSVGSALTSKLKDKK